MTQRRKTLIRLSDMIRAFDIMSQIPGWEEDMAKMKAWARGSRTNARSELKNALLDWAHSDNPTAETFPRWSAK